MIEGLIFTRPLWLLGVVPALLLVFLWARQRIASSHWEGSVDPALLEVLLEPGGQGKARRVAWLVAAALAIAAVGLAGPAWQKLPQPVEEKRDALVIVFDLSLSMFAEDVRPSRLTRARQKITDVLRLRSEGYTALVAYAGDAHTVAPLTDDVRTIENLLAALNPAMMPVLGSNLESALEVSATLLENAAVTQGRLLLVTDGIDDSTKALARCRRSYPMSILGVGTERGATIPLDFVDQPGQVLRTQAGDPITARLDEARLENAAARCFGRYRTLGLGDEDIDYLLSVPLPSAEDTEAVEREFDTWADQGYLVGLLLVPLLLLGFRRGVFALALLYLLPLPVQANIWDDLWQRPDQQAHQQLQQGDAETAASLFEDGRWEAVARYRAADYAGAASGFSGFDDPESTYNLGNAFARAGQYEAAIEAYDSTLNRLPEHEDALFNRELVRQLLQEQQSQQQQSDGDQGDSAQDRAPSQDQGSSVSPPQSEQNQGHDQAQDEQAQQQQRPIPEDAEEPAETELEQASRDERQDAMEQWLRRVPDDPGGLLRRKFQYETNQRLRRGDYSSRETEKIW